MNGAQTFYNTVIVLATVALAALLYLGREVVIVVFISILLASATRPLVDSLVRVVRFRALAVLLVYLVLLAAVLVLVVVSLPPIIRLAVDFIRGDKVVQVAQGVADQLSRFGWQQFRIIIPTVELPAQAQALMGQAGQAAQDIALPTTVGTLLGLGQFVLALVMALYWLTAREQMLRLVLRMSPTRQRAHVETIWTDVEETLGAYLRGTIILMMSIGVFALTGLLALGVPYALALATFAALAEGIPLVGPFIGAVPALIVGFSVSTPTGILVAVWYFAIQEIEAYVLVPKVMEKSVGLHPLLVIIALLVGATLNGVIGALIAVPIAGAAQVIVRSLLIEPAIESNGPQVEAGRVTVDPKAIADRAVDEISR